MIQLLTACALFAAVFAIPVDVPAVGVGAGAGGGAGVAVSTGGAADATAGGAAAAPGAFFMTPSPSAKKDTLKFVTAIWRHGDRSTATPLWKGDTTNVDASWARGLNELSVKGMRQHYELGTYLRKRYDGFLSAKYNSHEFYVRTNEVNRTVQSALANMAGFFPVTNPADGVSDTIAWAPVPVHVKEDQLNDMNHPCAAAQKALNEQLAKPDVAKILTDNAPFLATMTEKTGIAIKSLFDVASVFDPLWTFKQHNDEIPGKKRLPDWADDATIAKVEGMYDQLFHNLYATPAIQKFRGGPLLHEIIDRMDVQAASDTSPLKYYVYSSQDFTVAAMLECLGAYDDILPNPHYASAILLEMHKVDAQYNVELYYRNTTATTQQDAFLMPIGGCPYPCSLTKFRERSKALFLDTDFDTACKA
jgi:hypothetical protein